MLNTSNNWGIINISKYLIISDNSKLGESQGRKATGLRS